MTGSLLFAHHLMFSTEYFTHPPYLPPPHIGDYDMLNHHQFSLLIDPVICRAIANDNTQTTGFVDRAAHYVLKRLSYDASTPEDNSLWKNHRTELNTCQWLDQQMKYLMRLKT